MARSKVSTRRLSGGLGRRLPNTDGVIGVISTGVAVGSGLTLGVIYPLNGIGDLEALGVDAAYDVTNTTLLHYHISEIFRINPSAEVHLMVLAQSTTLAAMVDVANTSNAKKLSKDLNGRIRILGVIRNPIVGYTPTLTTGLDADVLAAIPKAQALVDEEALAFRYLDTVVVEGRSYNGAASSAQDLRAITNVEAPGVCVPIFADNDVSLINALYAGHAAVGTMLGLISKAAVSQDPAELTDDFNIVDVAAGKFVNVGLSSGAKVNTLSDSSLTTLDGKGYIFAEPVAGISGIFINDSHCCVGADDDYAYIENNRTINKAINLSRIALLPMVKSRLMANEDTGLLSESSCGLLEDTAKDSLDGMKKDQDLSGGVDAWVDPTTDVLAGDDIEVELTFIPRPIGREIKVAVGFSNPNA